VVVVIYAAFTMLRSAMQRTAAPAEAKLY